MQDNTKQSCVIAVKADSYCDADAIVYQINGKKKKCQLTIVPQQLR